MNLKNLMHALKDTTINGIQVKYYIISGKMFDTGSLVLTDGTKLGSISVAFNYKHKEYGEVITPEKSDNIEMVVKSIQKIARLLVRDAKSGQAPTLEAKIIRTPRREDLKERYGIEL